MSQPEAIWPPVIIAKKSFWIGSRDFVLTTVMWLVFAAMLEGEFRFLFRTSVDHFGLSVYLERIGFSYLATEANGPQFLYALAPYLGIALILIVSLMSFAIDTIRLRRNALRGPRPPSLDPAIEAHHAELSTMAGHTGEAVLAQRADIEDIASVDLLTLLDAIDQLDEAALADARTLRVVNVHVTTDGHYRIQSAA